MLIHSRSAALRYGNPTSFHRQLHPFVINNELVEDVIDEAELNEIDGFEEDGW